jgi:hypothetical protein
MVSCEHCGGRHEAGAKFCSTTGQPLGPAVATERVQPLGTEKGLWDLFRESAILYRANLRVFLITAAILFVPGSFLTSCALLALSIPASGFAATLLGLVAWGITALLVYGSVVPVVHGALTIAVADRLTGGQAAWPELWARLLRRLSVLTSVVVPTAILLGVGFLLGVLPGLVAAFFCLFVAPVALIEGVGGIEAIKRSAALVRADWLRCALLLVAFGITWSLAHWLAGAATFFANFIGDLLFLLVMPVPMIAAVLLYLDLRRKLDGLDEDTLNAELEALRPPL